MDIIIQLLIGVGFYAAPLLIAISSFAHVISAQGALRAVAGLTFTLAIVFAFPAIEQLAAQFSGAAPSIDMTRFALMIAAPSVLPLYLLWLITALSGERADRRALDWVVAGCFVCFLLFAAIEVVVPSLQFVMQRPQVMLAALAAAVVPFNLFCIISYGIFASGAPEDVSRAISRQMVLSMAASAYLLVWWFAILPMIGGIRSFDGTAALAASPAALIALSNLVLPIWKRSWRTLLPTLLALFLAAAGVLLIASIGLGVAAMQPDR